MTSSAAGLRAATRARQLVRAFFGDDAEKTKLWFGTPNPLLGYVKPNDLIYMDKADKLLQFVERTLEENSDPLDKERAT